jgi:hypothetical protein
MSTLTVRGKAQTPAASGAQTPAASGAQTPAASGAQTPAAAGAQTPARRLVYVKDKRGIPVATYR